jgi:predicted MFS family arabinose efflux permease
MAEPTTRTDLGPRPAPLVPLWRNRDYMVLWSGQVVSVLGGGISGIAFPLLVLALTGSPAQAGLVTALFGLPYLVLSLPAGALIDRWDRKRVMILCDVGRGLNAATIPLAATLFSLTMPQLYVNALVEGTLFVFFNVAEVAALPRVVPQGQIASASGQNEAAQFAANLIAPPVGGLLFQTVGRTIPFLADAISYGASVISLLFVRTAFQGERSPRSGHLWSEVKEGIDWLWHQPMIRFITVITGGLNFAGNATYLIMIVLARQEGASSAFIGVMLALASVGGFVGSLLAPRIQRRFRFGQVIIGTVWLQTLLYPLFVVAPNPLFLGAVFGGLALCGPIYNATQLSYRMSIIPDQLQGRVSSAIRLVAFGTIPAGTALAGVLMESIGIRPAILVYGGVMLLLAIAVAANGRLRQSRLTN